MIIISDIRVTKIISNFQFSITIMDVKIEQSWKERLSSEFEKDYFSRLITFVKEEYRQRTIYPPGPCIFSAFEHCPFDKVKVVILGQDPYHEPGQAHGLCFSVQDGTQTGNLLRWADQGVLLLNATLTVRAHQAGSHQNKGWEEFTDAVIHRLAEERSHIVYILWGSYAQRKGAFINASRNLILKSAHPSPLSAYRGFFGNKHFSKANDYLIATGQTPIEW